MPFQSVAGSSPLKMSTGDRVLIALMTFILIASFGFGITAQISSGVCEKRASALSAAYSWDMGSGCYIEVEPNRWVPLDRL